MRGSIFIVFLCSFLGFAANGVARSSSIIGDQELIDLQIIPTDVNPKSLSRTLIKPITEAGGEALETILRNPHHDLEKIEQSQKFLQWLGKNPQTRKELAFYLKRVAKFEKSWSAFTKLDNKFMQNSLDHLFFHDRFLQKFIPGLTEKLNKSQTALTVKHVVPMGVIMGLFHLVVFNKAIDTHSGGSLGKIMEILQPLHGVYEAISLWENAHDIMDRRVHLSLIYTLVRDVRQGIDDLEHIARILPYSKDSPVDSESRPEVLVENLRALLPQMSEIRAQNLPWFSNIGKILVAYRDLFQKQEELHKLMAWAGRADTYLGVANLMVNSKDSWSYSQFSQDANQAVRAEKLWNPLLDPKQAISTELNWSTDQKIMLSAPNRAGKSTFMRAIGINAVLSQTFGIASAKKFQLYPVEKILTYMKVHENISQGHSMFVAEVMRGEQFLQVAKKTPNASVLMLVDDSLYRSTEPKKALGLTVEFVDVISSIPGARVMIATHLEEVIQAADKPGSKMQNWHIEITKNGKSRSSYQLKPGNGLADHSFELIRDLL